MPPESKLPLHGVLCFFSTLAEKRLFGKQNAYRISHTESVKTLTRKANRHLFSLKRFSDKLWQGVKDHC
jgi:hypothetical protein